MDGGGRKRREVRFHKLTSLLRNLELRSEECLCRGCAQRDDAGRPDDFDLGIEPRTARSNLRQVRFLVDAPFSALGELEVLHRVRYVDLIAVDPGTFQSLIQDASRGADERFPGEVLLISGLLADKHEASPDQTVTEDGLGRILVKRTASARRRRAPECGEREPLGEVRPSTLVADGASFRSVVARR
jgi:hypothetical protein